MSRPVPKISGLIKNGGLAPSADAQADGAPTFHIGGSKPTPVAHEGQGVASASTAQGPADSVEIDLPLSRLKIHPFNSRTLRTQERIEEVRDMLAESTQREAVTVVPGRRTEDRHYYYILSGQTRYHSANLAGWTTVRCKIDLETDPDDHLAFFAASVEHNTSLRETDWDLAVKAKMLLDEGHPSEKVQKAVRRDVRAFRRLLAMADLPERVLAIVREHPVKLTASFAEEFKAALPTLGDESVAEFALQVVAEDLSVRALQQLVERAVRIKAREGGRARRATREFMTPIVLGKDRRVGEFKVMQSRQVEGNRLITLSADLPESLSERFKADMEAAIARLKEAGREP